MSDEVLEPLLAFQKTRERDAHNLAMLRRAQNDFWDQLPFDQDVCIYRSFAEYAKQTYGIRIHYNGDWLNPVYEVIDEELHTLFLLKYG